MHTHAWGRIVGICALSVIIVASMVVSRVAPRTHEEYDGAGVRIDMVAGVWGAHHPFLERIREVLGMNDRITTARYELTTQGETLAIAPVRHLPAVTSPLFRYALTGETLVVSVVSGSAGATSVPPMSLGAPRTTIVFPGMEAGFAHRRNGLTRLISSKNFPRALAPLAGDVITPPFPFADFVRMLTPQTVYQDRGVMSQIGMSEHTGSLVMQFPGDDVAPEEDIISAALGTLTPSTMTARLPDGSPLREVVSGKGAVTLSRQGDRMTWSAGSMDIATGYRTDDVLTVSVGDDTSAPIPRGCQVAPGRSILRVRSQSPLAHAFLMMRAPLLTTMVLPSSGLDILLGHDEIGEMQGCMVL